MKDDFFLSGSGLQGFHPSSLFNFMNKQSHKNTLAKQVHGLLALLSSSEQPGEKHYIKSIELHL